MFPNEIRPYESNTNHCQKSCNPLCVAQMRVFDIESGGFHSPECGLDLPSPFISVDTLFRAVEADEDLKFRHTVGVLDSASGKINVLTFVQEKLVIKSFLPHFQGIEEPPCTDSFPGGRLDKPEILPDPDIISYMIAVEPTDPILADKLPVGNKRVDAFGAEQPDKSFNDCLAFLPIGVPFLRQKAEHQWECNPLVCHAEHKDVDVEITELPVCTVHAQHQPCLDGKQRVYHLRHKVKVEGVLGYESLNAAKVGVPFNRGWHCRREFMEAYGLYYTQSMEHESHKLYAGQIHRFPKMFLHNRKDLVNFAQVLKVSCLHTKKRSNFSLKILILRDFCKYKNLIIRHITT